MEREREREDSRIILFIFCLMMDHEKQKHVFLPKYLINPVEKKIPVVMHAPHAHARALNLPCSVHFADKWPAQVQFHCNHFLFFCELCWNIAPMTAENWCHPSTCNVCSSAER